MTCTECAWEHEETDPCLERHLAMAAKSALLLGKLKTQSDAWMARTALLQLETAAVTVPLFFVAARELDESLFLGNSTFVLLIPCDWQGETDEMIDAYRGCINDTARFLAVSDGLCVCRTCSNGQMPRAVRSLGFVLRGNPVIIYSAGQGISGFQPVKTDATFDLAVEVFKAFIKKYS